LIQSLQQPQAGDFQISMMLIGSADVAERKGNVGKIPAQAAMPSTPTIVLRWCCNGLAMIVCLKGEF
jgi:hypothetical protein